MAAVATEYGGAGGDNKVEVPNEVTAVGGEAVAVDGDNVDPSPLLRRHRRCGTTTFSAHCCAATTETGDDDNGDDDNGDNDEGDADGDGDDDDGHNGNDDKTATTRQ